MEDIRSTLKELGAANGLEIELDENGACTLELSNGCVMLLQERADLDELDFVATLGPVPEDVRAEVFTELLSANFYWRETLGATLSWNADIEEVVLIYPLPLAGATLESVETVFTRFADLQSAWSERLAKAIAAAQDRESDEDDDERDGADVHDEGNLFEFRV
jgi:hypothetical protein